MQHAKRSQGNSTEAFRQAGYIRVNTNKHTRLCIVNCYQTQALPDMA